MKKNIEWLKKEIGTEMIELEPNRKERWSDVKYQTLRSIAQKIDQLDEPEVLSQNWIDEHKESRINNLRKRTTSDVVPVDDLQKLLVPKQEITEEQVMNWLDKNDFYDHITAETVLERAVDKGELSYYGTKYSVIETPTIPKFVAEYLEFAKNEVSLMQVMALASITGGSLTMKKEYDWISANDETFARAWLDGYKVEEEPLYRVSARDMTSGFWFLCKDNDGEIEIGTNKDYYEADWDSLKLTEQEIRDYDDRYWAFAVKVEEER